MYKLYKDTLNGKWGKNTLFLEEVDSTNKYMLSGSFSAGDVVTADSQTAGRGRSGRSWADNKSSLLFTVKLPDIPPEKLFGAQIVAGFACCRALAECADVRLKWPNDLVISGKKLAGMLIETSFSGNKLREAVLGIGINVSSVPPELASKAACLADYGAAPDKGILLGKLVSALEEFYGEYLLGELSLEEEWPYYSAFYGKTVSFHKDGKSVTVREKGVTMTGDLIIEDGQGEKTVSSGEIGYDFNI